MAITAPLRITVDAKLRKNWSPAQIAGWLVTEYPDDPMMRVSHETIYRSLFVQARGVLKRELTAHLRTRRPIRRSKNATKAGQTRGQIVDAVSIAERPASIEDRAIPGHWEGDLLAGARNTYIATHIDAHLTVESLLVCTRSLGFMQLRERYSQHSFRIKLRRQMNIAAAYSAARALA